MMLTTPLLVTLVFSSFAFAADCPVVNLEPYSKKSLPKVKNIRLSASQAHCSPAQVFRCSPGQVMASEPVRSLSSGTVQMSAYCKEPMVYPDPKDSRITRSGGAQAASPPSGNAEREYGSGSFAEAMRNPASGEAGKLSEEDFRKLKAAALEKGMPELIFDRAVAHYKKERNEGKTTRPCFMAGDLTSPDLAKIFLLCGQPVRVLTMPSFFGVGEGSGCLDHPFKNRGPCAKYFGSKKNWCLPVGGAFRTGKSFRSNNSARAFIPLEGLEPGVNDNTKERRIGFHKTVTYDGRPYDASIGPDKSQGCFTLPHDIQEFGMDDLSADQEGGSMAFYAYPARDDIQKMISGSDTYWSDRCKKEIGKPAFFSNSAKADAFDPAAIQPDEMLFMRDYYQE